MTDPTVLKRLTGSLFYAQMSLENAMRLLESEGAETMPPDKLPPRSVIRNLQSADDIINRLAKVRDEVEDLKGWAAESAQRQQPGG